MKTNSLATLGLHFLYPSELFNFVYCSINHLVNFIFDAQHLIVCHN